MSAAKKAGIAAGGCFAALGVLGFGFLAIIGAAIQSDDDKASGAGAWAATELNSKSVPPEYLPWIIKAGATCPEAPAPLIAAQIETESAWNPRAVSPANAKGLSQFIPDTWAAWGVDANGDGTADPFTPEDAIMSQARYDCWVAKEIKSYKVPGDPIRLMLAGYNAGPDAVRQYGGIPPYKETQGYVTSIMDLMTKKYAMIGTTAPSDNPEFGRRVVAEASRVLGTPYAWGGGGFDGPSAGFDQGAGTVGFDCSSFVQFAVYQASKGKISLPRTSQEQAASGQEVQPRDLRPGDVIAFALHGGDYDHIGIFVGGTTFIHSPRTGDVVKFASLEEPYYQSKQKIIRRFGG